MMVPGSNLLQAALTVISAQPFNHLVYIGEVQTAIGTDVPLYDPPVEHFGSIQSVPRTLIQSLGLDWKKNYINIYVTDVMDGVARDSSGDRVEFNGKTFQVLQENDWQAIDNWNGVLCVEIVA